jgi:hypothetical protein
MAGGAAANDSEIGVARYLHNFLDLGGKRVELELRKALLDRVLEVQVHRVLHLRPRENVLDQRLEPLGVKESKLGQRVQAHGLDDELHLDLHIDRGVGLVLHLDELPADQQDRLEGAQPPVVVLLLREQLPRQGEELHDLGPNHFGVLVPFRVQNHLGNQRVVRGRHGHRPKQLLQVVGELGAPKVSLSRGVQGHEDPRILVDFNVLAQQLQPLPFLLQRSLDGLDLLRHRRQHLRLESIELVETAPGPALYEPRENTAHGFVVDPLIAIEDQNLPGQRLTKRLDRFRLPCACRAVRIAAVAEMETLRQGEIALVGQWRVHQLGVVSLVFVSVVIHGVAHAYHALVGFHVKIVSKLLLPIPIFEEADIVLFQLV